MSPPSRVRKKNMLALKKLNMDAEQADSNKLLQISELEELRNDAYESSRSYKDKTKKWHDNQLRRKEFKVGDKVLLLNARLQIFPGKLASR